MKYCGKNLEYRYQLALLLFLLLAVQSFIYMVVYGK